MRVSDVIAASLVAPLVAAHGGIEGAPRIFGMPRQLRASNPFAGFQARHAAHAAPALNGRQAAGPERCGPANGNTICGGNDCCSASGYCGITKEHCQAPDCLFNFGPGCDANKTPAGASTRDDARPQLGSIPYGGEGIYVCNNPGTVAITFDDGPYIYTEGVMKLFEARGAHATFFITGNNIGKGAIDENWAGVIKKMYDNGHQVASHTWSHQDLSLITKEQAYDQMIKNEMAIRNIIGKYPTYMRPPYSSCDADCQDVMADLGYVVSYFDLDTSDYLNLTPDLIQNAKNKFKEGIDTRNNGNFDGDRLVIGHDIHQLTAENLTAYMLDYLYAQGLKAVTMGECLQDPKENWYRDSTPAPPSTSSTRTSSAVPTATPTGPTSKDGSCGATGLDQSCVGFVGLDGLFGECCSQYGWCGNSADHCQTGCQAGFGKCGAQPSASPSASASVSASATGPVPTPTGPTTTDGSCGANGMTCIGFVGPAGLSECCSIYGWCGNSVDHCQTGCQAGFGKCGTQDISSSSIVISASSSLPASTSQVSSSPASATKDTVSSSVLSSVSASATDASSSVYVSSSASQISSAASATPTTSGEVSRDLESTSSVVPTASASEVLSSSVYSASASASASASDYVSASVSEHVSTSASASASEYVSASVSASASASGYISASASAPVSSSAYSVSASVSASVSEKSEAPASSTGAYLTSTDVSASKDSYPTGSASSEYPASTPEAVSSSAVPQSSKSSTVLPSFSLVQSSSSAYPISSNISSSAYASSSMTATPVYSASSFSTAIIPSSTPCSTSSVQPTSTALPVSSNGKCGAANGGQTCAGYKSPWGIQMGCCCKQSGKCSVDPWACGVGCDKGYGKCWF